MNLADRTLNRPEICCEMEPKEASNSLALRKVAALRKGGLKGEDFAILSFLVGSEDSDTAEEICACKFDLMVASEYFEGLLRSPFTPDGPIRIKHVEPEIFRLVVEFTHLSGQLVTEVDDLEQWLKLAAAADEFLLDDLGQLCAEKLQKLITMDNVWNVFSKNHMIKYTSSACEKLLGSNTDECLKKPAFLEIDEKALSKFLTFEMMQIASEVELVSACIEFVKGKEDERALFRRCALPHLRLLTLSADDLSDLAPFLEKDEKMLLCLNLLGKDPLLMKTTELMEATILCQEAEPRQLLPEKNLPDFKLTLPSSNMFGLVPLDSIPGFSCEVQQNEFTLAGRKIYNEKKEGSTFTLFVTANCPMKITGFDIFAQIDKKLFEDKHLISRMTVGKAMNWEVDTKVNISVTSNGITFKTTEVQKPTKLIDTWAHFDVCILLLGGHRAEVEVQLPKPRYVDRFLANNVKSSQDFTCSVQHKEFYNERYYADYMRCKEELNIFRSISYINLF